MLGFMKRIFFWAALAMVVPVMALAERVSATQGADLGTPKKALKFFDRVGTDASVDRATLFYHTTNDDERKVAKAFASVDLALAKLRKAVNTRFDREAGDAMVHALHDVTAEDVEAAKEEITGDKAKVSGKNFGEPLPMVKVKGAWKIAIGESIAQSNANVDRLVELCEDLVDAIERTEQEVIADKYVNASLLERGIKRRVKGILGE